jgi:hypothetical protein
MVCALDVVFVSRLWVRGCCCLDTVAARGYEVRVAPAAPTAAGEWAFGS